MRANYIDGSSNGAPAGRAVGIVQLQGFAELLGKASRALVGRMDRRFGRVSHQEHEERFVDIADAAPTPSSLLTPKQGVPSSTSSPRRSLDRAEKEEAPFPPWTILEVREAAMTGFLFLTLYTP